MRKKPSTSLAPRNVKRSQQQKEVDPHGSDSPADAALTDEPKPSVAFRPLFRFFREGLTRVRQDAVQDTLCAVVRGDDPVYLILGRYRELRPFLQDGHPMKKQMGRLVAGLRAEGVAGRRFALECLVAAGLPGLPERLRQLSDVKLPGELAELVRHYRL